MKVQGVDPTILNRIQGETSKQAVQEAKQARISGERQREKEARREAEDEQNVDMGSLAASLLKLNKAAEEFNIPLRFRIGREEEQVVVLVIDQEKRQVIRSILPGRVLEILSQWQYMLGLLVDQKM